MPPTALSEPSSLIAAFSRDQVALRLDTFDLCCLAGLYLRAEKDVMASFTEEEVMDVVQQVCEVVEPGAENPRKRATHAIQRLRDQRMLTRLDGAGVVRAGDYGLSRLATAVIEFFIHDEALTRESLTLLTRTLMAELAGVKIAAQRADTAEAWRTQVVGPIRVTFGVLVGGIESRQQRLDATQEAVQEEILQLLQADWFSAVGRSEALLEATSATLRELNEVLLRDTHQVVALLQEIQALAEAAGATEAEAAVQRAVEQVDRIGAWGTARQHTWSDFYQRVHRYLRDVVRLDPDRAMSQRLRDQVAAWTQAPFFLNVAAEPSIRLLRSVEHRVEHPPVARPTQDREAALVHVSPEDHRSALEDRVRTALASGATRLSQVTAQVLSETPSEDRFVEAGRVASVVATHVHPTYPPERPWVCLLDALNIEDWELPGGTT